MDVLVVDGDALAREAVAEALEEEGLEVAQASSGEVAVQAMDASAGAAPKVLVSDVHLGPGRMDGTALAAALRGRWPALGVVVISGHGQIPGGPDALAGHERHLVKPFPPGALVRAVRELTDHAGADASSCETARERSSQSSPSAEPR
jgi:two-component system, NtrC family, nitrogen regulation response regulator NtrX